MNTILVMAGGTGGHVFPALAVAENLRAANWRVVWLGSRNGMEAELVPKHGYEMAWVRFSAIRGKGLMRKLLLPLNLLIAFWQCARTIMKLKPNVVLGMGGYIAFPGGMMASLLNYPLVVHEQNSIAGLTNGVLARLADRVLTAFPNVFPKLRNNVLETGNPVRADISNIAPPLARFANRSGALRVLVVGGSLGAQVLNENVPKALALIDAATRPVVIHQAGTKHIDALRASYRAANITAELLPFITDIAKHYAEADLVVCRAGALTVSELAAAGVASVLVPYPHAVDDHQTANARYLSANQAAFLVPQAELTPERLADLLRKLTRTELLRMAEAARLLGKPDATARVAHICVEAAR